MFGDSPFFGCKYCVSLIHPAELGPLEKESFLLSFPLLLLFDEGGQRERDQDKCDQLQENQ